MNRKQNGKIANYIRVLCLSGALVAYSASAYAVVANNTLPSGGDWKYGSGTIINPANANNIMNITQNGQNAVIKWGDFSIGANATVNFDSKYNGAFNILNYVDSGKVSEIYGAMNAKDGNVFVANTAGVVIGKSAQINVGSLYVTNKKLNENQLGNFKGNINDMLAQNQPASAAELMSLGNINAKGVTFDGDRVVLDIDRLSYADGSQMKAENIVVKTTDAENIVLGYSAYDANKKTYAGQNSETKQLAKVNDGFFTQKDGYMWVKNIDQLQDINTNLGGNYALNDSIDAIVTKDWNDGKGFVSIGNDTKAFTGKFDGLDYAIFGLTINRAGESNVGLFGVANGAVINNVTLVSGNITGGANVGSVVGSAANGTKLNNIVNSAHVIGNSNVGGVVGSGGGITINGAINTAPIKGHENVGGLAGSLTNNSSIVGNSYNLGAVTGIGGFAKDTQGNIQYDNDGNAVVLEDGKYDHKTESASGVTGLTDVELTEKYSHNIGGLVGSASNSKLGDGTTQIFNQLDVTGGYNVGGIVGSMVDGSTVTNAANNGNITATGYTSEKYIYHGNTVGASNTQDGKAGENIVTQVNVANVGGIAGNVSDSSMSDVNNTGDIQSIEITKDNDKFHIAGNVGGIAGRAENTNITNAENKENEIYGAHNVGGIAGYFGGTWGTTADNATIYAITGSINNGGEVVATGARDSGFEAQIENVTKAYGATLGNVIIGNMGGIAGYMYGDNTQIKDSANRGTIHSRDIENNNIKDSSKAANAGGVVGKIDRSDTISISDLKTDADKAAVVDSYNTGSVRGYANLGGVAGMMYNGEIVRSYNAGNIRSTRKPELGTYIPVNMGGIVGDTTEYVKGAHVSLYDVYNRGDLGDKNFEFGARHVGGIVGRLSGDIDTAYNKGNIYSAMIVNGGIAGWWTTTGKQQSSITNVFNAGNITVLNKNQSGDYVSTGGIVGATGQLSIDGDPSLIISNAYNLGTIRSFNDITERPNENDPKATNSLGGIVGTVNHGTQKLTIDKVYTVGELYAAIVNGTDITADENVVKSIWGATGKGGKAPNVTNAYYIEPTSGQFTNLAKDKTTGQTTTDGQAKVVKSGDKDKYSYYAGLFSDVNQEGEESDTSGGWRIYDGTTPILNAFLPKLAEGDNLNDKTNIKVDEGDEVQYGTAYNPFATIITTTGNKTITVDDSGAGAIGNVDSIIVNGGSLTINDAVNTGNTLYNGILYADGALTLNGSNISLGSISHLYGSSVTVNSDGDLRAYGDIVATGKNGTSDVDISATNGNIEILGSVTAKKAGETTIISDIGNSVAEKVFADGSVKNPSAIMPEVSDQYKKDVTAGTGAQGNITINAKGNQKVDVNGNGVVDKDGNAVYEGSNVDILYGNLGQGFINASGSLTVSGKEVYMDSDLLIGGNLNINGDTTVLDISNIGKVQAKDGLVNKGDNQSEKELVGLHQFLDHFKKNGNTITMKDYSGSNSSDAMIAVDLWDESKGKFDLGKYDIDESLADDTPADEKHYLYDDLNALNLKVNGTDNAQGSVSRDVVHVWVSSGEQLKALQTANDSIKDDENTLANIFKSNIALKNDIDMSDVSGFVSIGDRNKDDNGKEVGFTGKFDGRGNRIIGLEVSNGGLFSTIGKNGAVDDVKIYSSNINSDGNKGLGLIASENYGNISNVSSFGNNINVIDNEGAAGIAGGIVGVNYGTIEDTTATNVVQSSGSGASILGGVAGSNSGKIQNTESNSAITASNGNANAMGGIVGNNSKDGNLQNVTSQGVVTGLYNTLQNSSGVSGKYIYANNVGGIAGNNAGTINETYNDSIVSGFENVGGIVGNNTGTANNLANATYVYGGKDVGGIVGTNDGSTTNGRNNGSITGAKGIVTNDGQTSEGINVGGLVGISGLGSKMENMTNDMSASIEGYKFVGGIVGLNMGELAASNNLMNKGSIKGHTYVGGIAGVNAGTIKNISLANEFTIGISYANDSASAEYFGGIAGLNIGTITKAVNSANLVVDGATYVGGIVGQNGLSGTDEEIHKALIDIHSELAPEPDDIKPGEPHYTAKGKGTLTGEIANNGKVNGTGFVGGVVGLNTDNSELKAEGGIIKNTGAVTSKGGAGGIIGENHADLKGLTIQNSGTVVGDGSNVGGTIGYNKGDIIESSLTNTITGTVTGIENVGGLIGTNTGLVQGGRDANDQYYKYQVYNNGTVSGDTNVGGLIGNNAQGGTLDAAYNTGSVSGNINVGGVVGINSGNVSQVFSNIMVPDADELQKYIAGLVGSLKNYEAGTVTGTDNVGGLIGENAQGGTLKDAYNVSAISGNGGNAVGINAGQIDSVYSTLTSGTLIGSGEANVTNSYSASTADKNKTGITYLSEEELKYSGNYSDGKDGFKHQNNGKDVWRFYDGFSNPLLKVFLTKAVYNGFDGTVDSSKLHGADGNKAYNSNNSLVSAGSLGGLAYLYSGQIAWDVNNGIFGPNNLGYDLEVTYAPDKAKFWEAEDKYAWGKKREERERKAEVYFVDGGMEL